MSAIPNLPPCLNPPPLYPPAHKTYLFSEAPLYPKTHVHSHIHTCSLFVYKCLYRRVSLRGETRWDMGVQCESILTSVKEEHMLDKVRREVAFKVGAALLTWKTTRLGGVRSLQFYLEKCFNFKKYHEHSVHLLKSAIKYLIIAFSPWKVL